MCLLVFRWFIVNPPRIEPEVPVPNLRGQKDHKMTVLPYIIDYFDETKGSSDDFEEEVEYLMTEREYFGMEICLDLIYKSF